MRKPADPEGTDPEVLERLRAYTALDNPIRLRAFRLIHESPGVPFNEIAKRIRIESGLLAYHMGVLRAAGVVDVTYERDGRQVTAYRLGARGEELFSELFRRRQSRHRKPGRPSSVPWFRANTDSTQLSAVRRLSRQGSNRASHQEECHEQEHDSGAHHDNQDEGAQRGDEDPDAPRKQQNQSEDAGQDTRPSLPGSQLLLRPPALGRPRGFRLHAPSFERAYLMPPTPQDAQGFCTNPRMA